jgi:hypothetical protein
MRRNCEEMSRPAQRGCLDNLSDIQALKAIPLFLEGYFERTKSDDIGSLLGDLQLADEGTTFDPAVWDERRDFVTRAKTWISN